MRYVKVLRNNNEIISQSTGEAFYKNIEADKFSIHVVFSGSQEFIVDKRKITLYPGNFFILNEGTEYSSSIDSVDVVQTFSICFDAGYIREFKRSLELQNIQLIGIAATDDQPLLETIYPFHGDMKYNLLHLKKHLEAGVDDEMLLNEYMYHCLLNFYRIYNMEIFRKGQALNFQNDATRTDIVKRLAIAKDYISSNYDKDLKLEDIAQNACLSVNHLLRTFKQAYNKSPHQYLTEVRLKQARHLLKNTKYPVNEIVQIVGFECPSSFIRLFKSTYSITPKNFRLN